MSDLPEFPRDVEARRRFTIRALGVSAVLAGLAAAVFFMNRSASDSSPESLARLSMPPAPAGSSQEAPVPASAPEDRPSLYQAPAETLSVEEFLKTAKATMPEPLADKILDEFMAAPTLKKEFEEFKRDEGMQAPATSLAARVGPKPEFHKLVSQFKDTPGFQAAFMTLTSLPGMKSALTGSLAQAKPTKGALIGHATAAALTAKHTTGSSNPRSYGSGGSDQALTDGRVGSPGPGGSGVDMGPRGPATAAAPSARAGSGEDLSNGGLGAGGATPLGALDTATSEKMKKLKECYPPLGQFSDPQLNTLITVGFGDGMWGECFNQNIFAKCKSACSSLRPPTGETCNTTSRVACAVGDGWNECMDSFDGNTPKCIQTCGKQSPCVIDDAAWDSYCEEPVRRGNSAPSYCLGLSRSIVSKPGTLTTAASGTTGTNTGTNTGSNTGTNTGTRTNTSNIPEYRYGSNANGLGVVTDQGGTSNTLTFQGHAYELIYGKAPLLSAKDNPAPLDDKSLDNLTNGGKRNVGVAEFRDPSSGAKAIIYYTASEDGKYGQVWGADGTTQVGYWIPDPVGTDGTPARGGAVGTCPPGSTHAYCPKGVASPN
ncbi:MAG: hypothetical protein HY925_03900 [Elusimicrobia bacterium]|nr:hypothetical protein [Elusimicrobiota bacterium]